MRGVLAGPAHPLRGMPYLPARGGTSAIFFFARGDTVFRGPHRAAAQYDFPV
jgi:hypothetical protein